MPIVLILQDALLFVVEYLPENYTLVLPVLYLRLLVLSPLIVPLVHITVILHLHYLVAVVAVPRAC